MKNESGRARPPCYSSSSFSFLSWFATPLLFRLELGFPKPIVSYPIAAEARKFIVGCAEELKRLRTIRTDTKLNSYVSRLILISPGDFAVNCNRDVILTSCPLY